jgi:hypothetical protein
MNQTDENIFPLASRKEVARRRRRKKRKRPLSRLLFSLSLQGFLLPRFVPPLFFLRKMARFVGYNWVRFAGALGFFLSLVLISK